jgi:hypothetical protein
MDVYDEVERRETESSKFQDFSVTLNDTVACRFYSIFWVACLFHAHSGAVIEVARVTIS